ncbi:OprO/OprP family phosphate-selective porin [Hyalangium gracile]|uniref:OprO/OprP family phosphate-selective porin n=1 Tax=Hyalangium gracile TaxID=394092 RepID=UPI001CCE8506|nr:OprO/OprP family phosphate-selective porin [Hyalangium gracile]
MDAITSCRSFLRAMPWGMAALLAPLAQAWPGEEAPTAASQPAQPAESPPPPASDSPATRIRWRPGKGLEINSEDERFRLVTRLRGQFLYQAEDTPAEDEGRTFEHGFMLRRARVAFSGFMFGEHNTFKLELAFSPRDIGFTDLSGDESPPQTNRDNVATLSPLLELYMEFDHLRDLTLRVGQYKVPFNRQRVISSGDLMLVDRSIVNSEFNLDRDIGVDLRSEDLFGLGLLRYYAGVFIGGGHSYNAIAAPGLMALARVEVLPFGSFEDYSEADLKRSEKPGLSLGAAFAHLEKARATRGILGRAPRDDGTTDYDVFTVDAMFKWRGFSAQSEFSSRRGSRNAGDAVDDEGAPVPTEAARNGYGWFLQAGYLLPRIDLEFSARYSLVRGSGDDTSLSHANEAGVGVSYYFHEHSFKLQGDVFRIWEPGSGERDNQFRVQLQTAF